MLGGGIAIVKGDNSAVPAVAEEEEEEEEDGGGENKPLLSHQLYIAFSDLFRVGVCVYVCVCVKWYK